MKKLIPYLLTIIITAVIAGGGVFLWQSNMDSATSKTTDSTDIAKVEKEVRSLSAKLSRKNHSFVWNEGKEETAKKAKSIIYHGLNSPVPDDQDSISDHISYIENQIRMLYKNFTDEIEKVEWTKKMYEGNKDIQKILYTDGLKNLRITKDIVKKALGEPAEVIKESATKEVWPYECDYSKKYCDDGEHPVGFYYYFENGKLYNAERGVYWGPNF